jgi:hypothetical protein
MEKGFWSKKIARRDFFKASAGAAAALTISSMLPERAFAAARDLKTTQISWNACQKLTPAEMAKQSGMMKLGYDYLLDKADKVKDQSIRTIALEGLKSPQPKILELFPDDYSKGRVRQKLLDAGYIKNENTLDQIFPPDKGAHTCVQEFYVSPGSGWGSHHAYPTGLVTHVATDLQIALRVFECYENMYGYDMDRELLVSAILLHDNQKPWVLQWREDNACLPEINIAGTGCHHIMEIADVMHRGLEPKLVVAIACSHDHPGWPSEEANVVDWIKAAGIITDTDPIKYGLLATDGKTLPLPRRQEGFLVHLGDHDYVLTAPVSKWLSQKLMEVSKSVYHLSDTEIGGKAFNTLRNYLYSQKSDMQLYQIWVDGGDKALVKAVTDIVTPR